MPLSSPLASLLEKRPIVEARALVGRARARIVLRSLDAVGGGSRVDGRDVIENLGRIELGAGSVLRGIPTAVELASGSNGVLRIERHTIINSGASICAHSSITIGDRALIEPGVMINDPSFLDLYERHVMPAPLAVVIEDDVWIGAKASVLPGVHLGRRAVVVATLNPRMFLVEEAHR